MVLDRRAVLRYLGGGEPDEYTLRSVDWGLEKLERIRALSVNGTFLPGQTRIRPALSRGVLLFAVTLGQEFCRYLSTLPPPRRAVLEACANAALDKALEDNFEAARHEAARRGLYAGQPLSPGCGGYPMRLQAEIIALLRAEKRIGVTCNECFALTPEKSLTGIVGFYDTPQRCLTPCSVCVRKGCQFRRIP